MRGEVHDKHSVAAMADVTPQTAARWLKAIEAEIPGVYAVAKTRGKTLSFRAVATPPPQRVVAGACVAASLASIFSGSMHEHNLREARDYLAQLRGTRYEHLDRKFVFAPKGGEYALPDRASDLDELIDALLTHRKVSFSYVHGDGHHEKLAVCPLSLMIFDHQFYLLGQREDGARYPYRFARMNEVTGQARGFRYPTKLEYDPLVLLAPNLGVHLSNTSDPVDVTFVLTGPWARFAETHRWHPQQRLKHLSAGAVEIVLPVRVCREVETLLLGFGEHAIVRHPASLRGAIGERLKAAAARYQSEGPSIAKAEPAPARTARKRRDTPRPTGSDGSP